MQKREQKELQFVQDGEIEDHSLRKAVDEVVRGGSNSSLLNYIFGFMMTQMSAKAGIKKHGKVAVEALFQKFLQLHNKAVFQGEHAHTLTKAQKGAALHAISVIKEKRTGTIKGRTVADGRSQRPLFTKDQTTSPTVTTDALMMTIMIEAKEQRDVATADVVGAYLNANMDDYTLLKITGASVDIMCKVSSVYEQFVTIENGK
jgi:hypothetical protein